MDPDHPHEVQRDRPPGGRDAVVAPAERALLDHDVVDHVPCTHLDVSVGKVRQPAAVEVDARRLALLLHPARRAADDIVREHLREPVEVMGIERLRGSLDGVAVSRHREPRRSSCGGGELSELVIEWAARMGTP